MDIEEFTKQLEENTNKIIENMNKLHSHEKMISNNKEQIKKNSYALEILKDYKEENNRLLTILKIVCVLFGLTICYLILSIFL